MIRDWVVDQAMLLGPALALLMFMSVFVVILFWVFRPGSTRFYDNKAEMPFEDGSRAPGANDKPTS